MKTVCLYSLIIVFTGTVLFGCSDSGKVAATDEKSVNDAGPGQSAVIDATSKPNIVQVASGSKDHTTLVAAIQAAGLVDALSNAGPFTVYAPTNAAFDKLPAGTVEGLLKPESLEALKNILEYHTYVGVLKPEYVQSGQEFEQVNGGKIKLTKSGDKLLVNGSEIVASIATSNGIIYVINDVLLPK